MAVLSIMAMFSGRGRSVVTVAARGRRSLSSRGKGGLAPGLGVLRFKNLLDAADRWAGTSTSWGPSPVAAIDHAGVQDGMWATLAPWRTLADGH